MQEDIRRQNQDPLQHLSSELSDVKKLLHQLLAAQGLSSAAQQHDVAGTQPGEGPCLQAAAEAPSGPKSSVHLDLPHDEQSSTLSQQQHLRTMLGQSLKPSISDAVLLQRAVHATQHVQAPEHDGHEPHAHSPQADAPAQDTSTGSHAEEHCSTASAFDAAVHVSAVISKQPEQLGDKQQGWAQGQQGFAAANRPRAAGAGREFDMLAKRVHADTDGGQQQQEQLQPTVQEGAAAKCLQAVVMPVKALLWDVVLPGDYLVLAWDLVMLLVILYLCIVLPYTVAFAIDFTDLRHPLARIDVLCTSLFLFDIWMNTRVAFVGDDGKVVTQRDRIIVNYLRGWFLCDLVSSLPYEQMLHSNEYGLESVMALLKVPRILRLVKVLRLLKMLRIASLAKLPALTYKVEWLLNRPMVQLATLCATCCMLLHWIACVWYWAAMLGGDGGWVASAGMIDASDGYKYVSSLYFSVSTLATVGFGDIVANTLREKIVAVIVMLIGVSVFGYFMGTMSVIVQASSSTRARMTARRRAVDDFLSHRRVPRALADKVKSYCDYVIEREVQADEADIIAGLSASLRTQVILHLYQEALQKVPFFRGQNPQFITSVVTVLQLEYYAPGDIVVRQGDMGDAMYFLGQGSLEVRLYEDEDGCPLARATYTRSPVKACKSSRAPTPISEHEQPAQQEREQASTCGWKEWLQRKCRGLDEDATHAQKQQRNCDEEQDETQPWCGGSRYTFEDELAHRPYRSLGFLHPGEYFGEYSCLLGQERSATVVAHTYSELYSLSRADLEVVLQQYPELAEQFESMVQEATGSLFPEQAASPLARWQQVKAACQQQAAHTGSFSSEMQQGQQRGRGTPEPASPGAGQVPAGPQSPERSSMEQPLQTEPSAQAGRNRLSFPFKREPSTGGSRDSLLFGAKSPSSQSSLPGSPRARAAFASNLQHARSMPMAINPAMQAARGADMGRVSFSPAETFSADSGLDPAVFDFPSLAARSVSVVSNMSGVAPSGPSTRNHRRSGSLTRSSLVRDSIPPHSVRANSASVGGTGSATLGRVSMPGAFEAWQSARQGTQLFRTNSGHRYLFPAMAGRGSVLVQSTETEEQKEAAAGMVQQQASISKRLNRVSN